jgi:hypothetical protein
VHITLYGELGDSGSRQLSNKWKNDFERGHVDEFVLAAANLGKLQKIRIGHDGTGAGAGWFLDKIVVKPANAELSTFPCLRWLDEKEEDGLTERELFDSASDRRSTDMRVLQTGLVVYTVQIKTANVYGAGTDANVKMTLIGKCDGSPTSSGERILNNGRGKFERGSRDTFSVEAADLGEITKVRIGHDNKGEIPLYTMECGRSN